MNFDNSWLNPMPMPMSIEKRNINITEYDIMTEKLIKQNNNHWLLSMATGYKYPHWRDAQIEYAIKTYGESPFDAAGSSDSARYFFNKITRCLDMRDKESIILSLRDSLQLNIRDKKSIAGFLVAVQAHGIDASNFSDILIEKHGDILQYCIDIKKIPFSDKFLVEISSEL